MKVKNKHLYSDDFDYLKTVNEEYQMMGYDTTLRRGELIVFALPRRKPKKKERR